jgi:hypothetical protein
MCFSFFLIPFTLGSHALSLLCCACVLALVVSVGGGSVGRVGWLLSWSLEESPMIEQHSLGISLFLVKEAQFQYPR